MPTLWIALIVLALAAVGYVLGRRRAMVAAGGDSRELHSLPRYYGLNVALTVLTPAFGLFLIWTLAQPLYAEWRASEAIPAEAYSSSGQLSLLMAEAAAARDVIAEAAANGDPVGEPGFDSPGDFNGFAFTGEPEPAVFAAALRMYEIERTASLLKAIAVLIVAVIGFVVAYSRITAAFRARNVVEGGVMAILILASSIAILTTVGIVLSMLFESINFFRQYPATEFFFGTNWAPNFRGDSDLGIIPLLWGTLYISLIALLVAVPVGLLAAIYMSEYATKRVRSIVKPVIEVLAGIPTIVYGLFALITVGPFLRDYFAQPLGLGNSSSSVMTAGLVMGIMLIPFVSSLSDDVINAVPQAMRDGSLGLGATHSETIRQVVLPAALPGIVGSILLAASRAIGETMIVVLGAGAAARLDLNPFEAMTTVTVKIVSQLTGDTDFASPETLVAFALGLTLFVMTLCLNVFALWIVRRYREQYE